MKRLPLLLCCCTLAVGCGPLRTPLPAPLADDDQKSIDEAWEKALTPMDRLDNQALLDAFLITAAYQVGVDKLSFRSEKRFSGGTVVMEVSYDRQSPAQDRFAVQVRDKEGKLLRQEAYGREQIEKTYRELFVEERDLRQKREAGVVSPEELRRLKGLEDRLAVIEKIFPKFEEREGRGGRVRDEREGQ